MRDVESASRHGGSHLKRQDLDGLPPMWVGPEAKQRNVQSLRPMTPRAQRVTPGKLRSKRRQSLRRADLRQKAEEQHFAYAGLLSSP